MKNRFTEFFAKKFSSGGGGSVTVKDEDTIVSSDVRVINFKGEDINAVQTSDGEVTVWVPATQYASHFGTMDGITDGRINLSNTQLQEKWISNPTTEGDPFYISTLQENNITIKYPSTLSNFYDIYTNAKVSIIQNSRIKIVLYNAETDESLETITVTITGQGTFTSGNLTVYVTNWEVDGDKFKANIRVRYNISSFYTIGRIKIDVTHENLSDGNFVFPYEYFKDVDDISFSVSSGSISVDIEYINFMKSLSGVKYITTGCPFIYDNFSISNVLQNSYKDTICVLDLDNIGVNDINLTRNVLSIDTEEENKFNKSFPLFSMGLNEFTVNKTNYYKETESGVSKIGILKTNWTNINILRDINESFIIDTLTSSSNGIIEDFRDENFRLLTSDFSTWDSNTDISNLPELQVNNDRLIYPTRDFSLYLGNDTIDYSTAGVNQDMRYFTRKFYHNNISHSNGIVKFEDTNITETDILNGSVLFEISVDGIDWFTMNNDYVSSPIQPGEGCRINTDIYNFNNTEKKLQFTLGFLATSISSDWGIYFRISMDSSNSDKYLGKITIEDWV